MKQIKFLSSILLLSLSILASSFALASNLENAKELKSGILENKNRVDNIIAQAQNRVSSSSIVEENDGLALPILVDASGSLGRAAVLAENAVLAFLGGNIALGNFRFALSCSKMGIGRSQLARSNFAALQPPAGFLAAFSPDIGDVVSELNLLKLNVGCP